MTTQIRILAACMATVIVATAGWSVVRLSAAPDSEFQGVWRTVEVVVPGAPGSPSHTFKPGATLAIFHGRRTPLANVMTASADDIRAVWGPFVAEAGTFDVGANYTVTMQATVAKNPADMNTGATSVYTYKREGDRLLLTQVRTPTGPSRNPITVTLARVE
ncbi:MAG TPA: hypothetical protein VJP86_02940 [Vicinamibacterales bacterium]|nr:hypothetical protein [Vicinamibacterales bacterium]